MPDEPLFLVKVPLRAEKLAAIARRRQIGLRNLDDGYLVHCLFGELWQGDAPAPFVLRGSGRRLDAWGYSRTAALALAKHALAFGDPAIVEAIASIDAISSKPMPRLETGRRVGFLVRVCPVIRLSKAVGSLRAGSEIDVFLARCQAAGQHKGLSRETIYREWFVAQLGDATRCGAVLARATGVATGPAEDDVVQEAVLRVAAIGRVRLVRRTQGDVRVARWLVRPDVRLEGDLVVQDPDIFLRFLARGVGRHRAFGFGAMILVPPGTSHDRG
jgi:CRISPR system Cascade subunit CasE